MAKIAILIYSIAGIEKKNSSSPSDKQVSYFAYPRQSDDISEPLPISIIICFTCRVFLKRYSKMTGNYCVSYFSYVTWTKKHMMCFPRKNVGCLVRLSVHSVIVIFKSNYVYIFSTLAWENVMPNSNWSYTLQEIVILSNLWQCCLLEYNIQGETGFQKLPFCWLAKALISSYIFAKFRFLKPTSDRKC